MNTADCMYYMYTEATAQTGDLWVCWQLIAGLWEAWSSLWGRWTRWLVENRCLASPPTARRQSPHCPWLQFLSILQSNPAQIYSNPLLQRRHQTNMCKKNLGMTCSGINLKNSMILTNLHQTTILAKPSHLKCVSYSVQELNDKQWGDFGLNDGQEEELAPEYGDEIVVWRLKHRRHILRLHRFLFRLEKVITHTPADDTLPVFLQEDVSWRVNQEQTVDHLCCNNEVCCC